MQQFMWGGLTLASLTATAFLIRFFHDSGERLFASFAAAFGVLALHWGLLGLVPMQSEHRPLVYLVRLLAFALLFVGIIDKNRRAS